MSSPWSLVVGRWSLVIGVGRWSLLFGRWSRLPLPSPWRDKLHRAQGRRDGQMGVHRTDRRGHRVADRDAQAGR